MVTVEYCICPVPESSLFSKGDGTGGAPVVTDWSTGPDLVHTNAIPYCEGTKQLACLDGGTDRYAACCCFGMAGTLVVTQKKHGAEAALYSTRGGQLKHDTEDVSTDSDPSGSYNASVSRGDKLQNEKPPTFYLQGYLYVADSAWQTVVTNCGEPADGEAEERYYLKPLTGAVGHFEGYEELFLFEVDTVVSKVKTDVGVGHTAMQSPHDNVCPPDPACCRCKVGTVALTTFGTKFSLISCYSMSSLQIPGRCTFEESECEASCYWEDLKVTCEAGIERVAVQSWESKQVGAFASYHHLTGKVDNTTKTVKVTPQSKRTLLNLVAIRIRILNRCLGSMIWWFPLLFGLWSRVLSIALQLEWVRRSRLKVVVKLILNVGLRHRVLILMFR